jgi:hypothetical protein
MKTLMKFLPLGVLILWGAAFAQEEQYGDARALLVLPDDAKVVWILAASSTNIEYKDTVRSIDRQRMARASIDAIYFFEPPAFKEARRLFKGRDYAGAKEAFTKVREEFKKIDDLPGNYSTLSGFYEIECARKQMDLEGMAAILEDFRPGSLVRETNKSQLEIYGAWDAVRTKSWRRLISMTDEMLAQKKWTGTQRAQIFYCRALAHEGLEEPIKALNAFNGTFTADYTASEVLTKKAALNCLRLIKNHEETILAMKLFGTEDENPNATGSFLLQEGVALCELWDVALGGGQPLPAEYKELLKFKKN